MKNIIHLAKEIIELLGLTVMLIWITIGLFLIIL